MDATDWDQRYSTTELIWTAEANQFVAAETEHLPPGRALDLAAGEGRNAIWLAQRGWNVTAVDFSQVALDKGRRLAESLDLADKLEWIRADVVTWTPPPDSYDLVVIAYLHLPASALRTAISHAASGLAAGGTIVIVGHDVTNLDGGTGGPQDPDVLYTPEQLTDIVAEAGLHTTKAGTVERRTANGVALDTLITATSGRPT